MASEVASNLKFELSDLNYPITHCFLASNATISRISYGRISSVDLRPLTSSQVKIRKKPAIPQTYHQLDAL